MAQSLFFEEEFKKKYSRYVYVHTYEYSIGIYIHGALYVHTDTVSLATAGRIMF